MHFRYSSIYWEKKVAHLCIAFKNPILSYEKPQNQPNRFNLLHTNVPV
jgi:hypothetical protein